MLSALLFILLNSFTLHCKPGFIYSIPWGGYDTTETELEGVSTEYYFYWEMDSILESGSYLYVSNKKDSVWFYVESSNAYYIYDNVDNSAMEILNE